MRSPNTNMHRTPKPILPLPTQDDTIQETATKMLALAAAVSNGENIAIRTAHLGTPAPERNAERAALAAMQHPEIQQYTWWKTGQMQLPAINPATDKAALPTSVANRKQHLGWVAALNILYDTDEMTGENVAWWAQKYVFSRPLLKALDRVRKAERNLTGGVEGVEAEDWGEYQSLRKAVGIAERVLNEHMRSVKSGKSRMEPSATRSLNGSKGILQARLRALRLKVISRQEKRGREESASDEPESSGQDPANTDADEVSKTSKTSKTSETRGSAAKRPNPHLNGITDESRLGSRLGSHSTHASTEHTAKRAKTLD